MRVFADDTSLYIVIETPDASAAVINSDLQKIATWYIEYIGIWIYYVVWICS